MEFILNGQGHGPMAKALVNSRYDLGRHRPFLEFDRSWATVWNHRKEKYETIAMANDTALLRYEDWREWDDRLIEAAKERLAFVNQLVSRGLTTNVNAMGTMVLSHERVSDITEAEIGMDPLSRSQRDQPEFDAVNLPLPLVYKDFGFPQRFLSVAEANGTQLDTLTGVRAARRVAEKVEALALGNVNAFQYQGYGAVYGLRTFPQRATKVMTLPTAPGWIPETTINELIDMVEIARLNLHYGPFQLFVSSAWSPSFSQDYSAAYAGETLRTRMGKIEEIAGVTKLDKMGGYQMILAEMDIDTMRMVIGMPLRLIQWRSPDGGEVSFRYLTCMVPQFFSDIAGNCGLVHGTAA